MGSSSSKAVRRLPQRAATPWAGARTPGAGEPAVANNEVRKDSVDPDFLTKLNKLGPIRVDHRMNMVKPQQDGMDRDVLKSRLRSESEQSVLHDTSQNLIQVSALFDFLEERKVVRDRQGLVRLGERYGIGLEKLENVARHVNTPSIDEGTRVKRIGENGEETVTMNAVWVEPNLASHKPLSP